MSGTFLTPEQVAPIVEERNKLRSEANAAWDSAEYNARRAEKAEAEIGRLRAEVERLRALVKNTVVKADEAAMKDAERYRYLRSLDRKQIGEE